jgi:hypothetical protein
MFKQWLETLDCEYTAYYIWSNPPDLLEKFLNNTDFGAHKNVVIGIKDLLDLWTDYNYWHQTAHAGTQLIDSVASKYPNTNFIICTSLENLHKETIHSTNIQIVPWGGDLVNQPDLYKSINPVLDKNFDSTLPFVCLNRNYRDHRIVLLSYLFGSGYNQYGQLSCLGLANINYEKEPDNFLDRIFWEFSENHSDIRDCILNGYTMMYNNQSLITDDYQIYAKGDNDNVSNFDQKLRKYYVNSFAEIITESSFASPGFLLTEKTMNSIYGCNFPILLSGAGAVAHLRNIGFDMFDDIIDHSYDQIDNPFDRIVSAVESNREILTDANYVKNLWQQNVARFKNNINVANNIHQWYATRGTDKFQQLIWK